MVEELVGQSVNGIIGPIFDALWSSLKAQHHAGVKDVELKQERIKADQAIAQASANYHQRYLKRHCNIKVLSGLMNEAKPLDTIYTAVKFLKGSDLKYFSLDNLEDLYRESGERLLRVGSNERQDGLTAANENQYLMVLGGPGVGKSTFLRKLGLEALENRLAHNLVPVFIELKSFKSEEMTLLQAIAKELEVSGFPYTENLVESMLSEGKMLLLFDGLDEVLSEQVDIVIEQIRNFCDQYQQNRFVASCRVAAYKGGFSQFTDVTMAEFNDEQIEQFVRSWFSSELDEESKTADQFWEILQRSENASAKELAQTPLLLTFLCLVYDRSQALPAVRSTLYEEALNIILKDWAAEKRIRRDPIYQGFHIDLEKELLSDIAYQSFKEDQLFFSKQEITERIIKFLTDTISASKYPDGTAVLEAIEVQQGILVERATNAYSFSHLTLQEYLTAKHTFSHWHIEELVSKHLTDERWREVFLLTSGLTGGRSHELLLVMEWQANAFISSPKLQGLLEWAMSLTDSSLLSSQRLASRVSLLDSAIVIAIARDIISAIVIASDSASAFASVSASTSDIASARASASARAIVSDIASASASDSASAIVSASDSASDSDSKNVTTVARDSDIARASDIAVAIDIDSDIVRAIARARAIASDSAIASVSDSARASDSDIARAIASVRVFAIISAIVRASAINHKALSKKLEALKEHIPSNEATANAWRSFADQLTETFLTFFHLDRELITFSPAEAQALEKYLYATKLIIDCKNSAVRVSRKEWEAIESRLLTPPSTENQD
ncbi:NACHT domain-containing protein [Leptolyngbya sp. Heron Island J]|uniref:NACHT domain-containing protein n=1 Tax=Leptolyngbya sp. Heron Island J TaxID=1385935 RepID=UPI001376D1E5|nr:NACHT domain-containing protein [Leptolyngbya sp. Heron Island J]